MKVNTSEQATDRPTLDWNPEGKVGKCPEGLIPAASHTLLCTCGHAHDRFLGMVIPWGQPLFIEQLLYVKS